VVDPNLPLEQLQTQNLQSQGQEVLADLADDSAERQDAEDAQKEDSESMEVELAQQGFDQAFDLDVPGYIEVLAGLLRKH
jgi:hypothetical protein